MAPLNRLDLSTELHRKGRDLHPRGDPSSTPPQLLSPIIHVERSRQSRDEMNLAEFPLTVLSTRANQSLKTLEFSDTIKSRNGEVVTRSWIITGADKFGLPTASDDEVLLGLLKLTVNNDFTERKVFFSRYELLKALRWTTEGRSYSRLTRALDRLSGVRIKATNAFYENDAKAHTTRNFGIIDAYEINDGRSVDPKPSFFIWSETLFRSFKVGFIKKLDLDFYLGLRSAVAKRLYRYLDKHFWYRARVKCNVFTLAHEKVGISRSYRHVSSLRQQLDPAFEELIAAGFLERVEYEGRGAGAEVSIIAGSRSRQKGALPAASTDGNAEPAPDQSGHSGELSTERSLHARITDLLIERGLKSHQVVKLLDGQREGTLERIADIVKHYDELRASESSRISRSPLGFLYRAVERPHDYLLPGEQQPKRPQQPALDLRERASAQPPSTGARGGELSLERDYLVERRRELMRIREGTESSLIEKIRREVDEKMIRLKGLISPDRYVEAVEHGVDEKLLRLYAFPEFRDWSRSRTKGRGKG